MDFAYIFHMLFLMFLTSLRDVDFFSKIIDLIKDCIFSAKDCIKNIIYFILNRKKILKAKREKEFIENRKKLENEYFQINNWIDNICSRKIELEHEFRQIVDPMGRQFIFNNKDKKNSLDKEIKALQKQLKDLNSKREDLEKKISITFTIDTNKGKEK